MTMSGWIFMLASNAFVLALAGFCFTRVIRKPAATEHMHSPIDIDTGDEGT